MGMNKSNNTNGNVSPQGAMKSPNDNGLDAAVERLKGGDVKPGVAEVQATAVAIDQMSKGYKPRDFDEEARGKTRCVMYAAALESMAIAGMKWSNPDELKKLIREMADDGVKYSFKD